MSIPINQWDTAEIKQTDFLSLWSLPLGRGEKLIEQIHL